MENGRHGLPMAHAQLLARQPHVECLELKLEHEPVRIRPRLMTENNVPAPEVKLHLVLLQILAEVRFVQYFLKQ
jgi:hypothetical protein